LKCQQVVGNVGRTGIIKGRGGKAAGEKGGRKKGKFLHQKKKGAAVIFRSGKGKHSVLG